MSDVSDPVAEGPKGIGGWLILPAVGTVASPFVMAYSAFQSGSAWNSSPSTDITIFIAMETLFNLGLMVAWTVAVFQLFNHKRSYPKSFVALFAILLVGTLLDAYIATTIFDLSLDSSDVRGMVRTGLGLAIWGPYMFNSKRVRNTFVED
jgi:Protein of unknown function (DUF2569)